MDKWQEIKVELGREAVEAASEIMINSGAQGLAIEDSADYLDHEDNFGEILPEVEQSDSVTIAGYYPETTNVPEVLLEIEEKIKGLSEFGIEVGEVKVSAEQLSEEDWADSWKKYYEPTRISHDLTIVPSWTDYTPVNSAEKIIRLDPGMAFGTGTHPTTKMSLFALEQILRGGERVLDVGTGSGVLSIASSLLGAGEIYAYDLDQVAVNVAQENIDLNENMTNIHVSANDLLKNIDQEADVIVANILADILIFMTDDAYRLLKDNGYLIMSGIIESKWDMVRAAAEKAGFFLETRMQQGEWNACIFRKTDDIMSVVGG
ncbi:50S ribosomal protein L11 methyltransferase [Streptococcaceae bacterium ESL0729]|nr:50S ribosomal protein L11 methyltransferase [Streptococcaceae bacterium ESL0729]